MNQSRKLTYGVSFCLSSFFSASSSFQRAAITELKTAHNPLILLGGRMAAAARRASGAAGSSDGGDPAERALVVTGYV